MARQLLLPKFSGVTKVRKERLPPQPRIGDYRAIKQFEIFHRPFDLRFRGRISEWLKQIRRQRKFNLNDVLDKNQLRIVRLYFFPQKPENKWLNQEEVLEKIGGTSKKKLRTSLISALVRIWKRDRQE